VTGLRAVTAADVPAVSAVLARAFDDDPVMGLLFPDPAARPVGLTRLFRILVRRHLSGRAVQAATDEHGTILAAALWDPPLRWRSPAWRELLALPAYAWAFRGRLGVAGRTTAAIEAAHPAGPHWYLAVVGTEPAAQGTGVGSALLRSRLERCDRDGSPAYLESSKETNIPVYEHLGFRVTGEITVPGGGPVLWPMWRDPAG
jgi:GNAT superfamily N-acetyltransferase